MPKYVSMTAITGQIPGPFLIEALDDDGDGAADPAVWDQVATDVGESIDGILGARYEVPFENPLPAVVVRAAKVLACEQIYRRRGKSGEVANLFTAEANAVRTQLAAIAAGDSPLDPAADRAKPSASIITEPASTTSSTGKLSA